LSISNERTNECYSENYLVVTDFPLNSYPIPLVNVNLLFRHISSVSPSYPITLIDTCLIPAASGIHTFSYIV